MNIWIILGVISVILLIISFSRGRNAIWGGLTLGIIVGLVTAIIYGAMGRPDWLILVKGGIIGVLVGFIFEIIAFLARKLFSKP